MTASEQEKVVTDTGGVRWGFFNATWPLARLSVGPEGIQIRPSVRALRLIGVPNLDLHWRDIDRVEEVVGALPLPRNAGIEFVNPGKRLIWWCGSTDDARNLAEAIVRYAPEKASPPQAEPKVVL